MDSRDITIKGLKLLSTEYPALKFYNAKDVIIEGLELSDSTKPMISVKGEKTENISINGKPVTLK